MMMHHHTKFGLDGLNCLKDITQTFTDSMVLNLHCHLDLEHSKAIFSQDTPPYDDVSSC